MSKATTPIEKPLSPASELVKDRSMNDLSEQNGEEHEDRPLLITEDEEEVPVSHVERKRPFRWWFYIAISSYWFGWSFMWLPLIIVIIPLQINRLVGDLYKGSSLSSTLFVGAVASLICAPLFGSLSDRCQHKMGRRRPFILVGTILASIAMLLLAYTPPLEWFSFAFLLLSIANNMILSPASALLPDVIPPDRRGIASGWIGGMSMLGSLAGGFLSYHMDTTGVFGAYIVMLLVHGLCALTTVWCVSERQMTLPPPPLPFCSRLRSFFFPFANHDFRMVFGTRFLMQMGILTVQEYLQYYLKDAIGPDYILGGEQVATTADKAVSILFIPVLFGSLGSSIFAGIISDRYGGRRKVIVYVSGALMSIACIFFSITRSFALDMFLGLIFGFGFGAFSVIDWAMATDVLPSEKDFAKDMGIWSLALVLPQVIAAPIAGFIIDNLERVAPSLHLGYSGIFLLAVLYLAGGCYYVKYVEKVK